MKQSGIYINGNYTIDIGLIMTARDIGVPTIQTYTVDVPGRNGSLDLSEFLTGDIRYNNRALKFSFYIKGEREQLINSINEMMLFHGQKVQIILDDYLNYHFIGRATIAYNDYKNYVEFEMSVDTEPFRYAIEKTSVKLTVSGSKAVTINNQGINVVPTIITTAEATVIKEGKRYTLGKGTFMLEDFMLKHGSNVIMLEGNSVVTFEFTEVFI